MEAPLFEYGRRRRRLTIWPDGTLEGTDGWGTKRISLVGAEAISVDYDGDDLPVLQGRKRVFAKQTVVTVRDRLGKTFVPAVAADGSSTLVRVGPNLHVASDTGRVVGAMNPGVVVRDGRTFVPGVSASGASTLVEIRPRGVSVVPAASATSGDDGIEWSPAVIGLTAALAVAVLMAVAIVGVAGGKRRRVATL